MIFFLTQSSSWQDTCTKISARRALVLVMAPPQKNWSSCLFSSHCYLATKHVYTNLSRHLVLAVYFYLKRKRSLQGWEIKAFWPLYSWCQIARPHPRFSASLSIQGNGNESILPALDYRAASARPFCRQSRILRQRCFLTRLSALESVRSTRSIFLWLVDLGSLRFTRYRWEEYMMPV